MQFSFDIFDIKKQVLEFMASLDIQPYDEDKIILDGTLHRYRVHDEVQGRTSGAICIHTDGWPAGYVQDWHKGIKESWKYEASGLDGERKKYFDSEEFKKKCEEEQKIAEKRRKEKREKATSYARMLWDTLKAAPDNHPYLVRKKVRGYSIRINDETNSLAVPLRNIEEQLMSIQWIPAEKDSSKMFYAGAPTKGTFYSIDLFTYNETYDGAILLGEGYATMAKIYELTSYPCVAAMSCHSLEEIAEILHKAYPKSKIIITADNDWETEQKRGINPGKFYAQQVVNRKLAVDVIAPEFSSEDTGLSDWDDYALKYGDKKTAQILQEKIKWDFMSQPEREEFTAMKELAGMAKELDKAIQIPPEDFIAGMFPRKRISAVIAPPGTGKTWFLQRVVSDISIGGAILDGFTTQTEQLKSVVFAGEAGPDLMIRRAAATDWPVNKHNVKIYGMVDAEKKGISLMLDETDGKKNIERIIKLHKPDIIFFDTLGSFHNRDENKADEMKPILRWLLTIAEIYNIAVVLMHHSRKMSSKEIGRALTQDDVIGSSIFNRLVSVIVCIQPAKSDDESDKTLMVSSLKSWFQDFMPFTYKLAEGKNGRTVMLIDLAPANVAGVNQTKFELWSYIKQNYAPDEWFKASELLQKVNDDGVLSLSIRQLQRYLSAFVAGKKLKTQGEKRWIEYAIIGFYDME